MNGPDVVIADPVPVPPPLRDSDTLITLSDRIYLASRTALATVLVVLYSTGVVGFYGHDEAMVRVTFQAGLLVFVAVTLHGLVSRLALHRRVARVLWEVLFFDLVAVGLLVTATGAYQDPFYPWILGLAIAYAVAMQRRESWIVAGLASAVYMAGHVWGHGAMHTTDDLILLALKAAAVVFTGVVVADAMARQAERESTLLSSQMEVEVLNDRLARRLGELHAVSEITEVIHSTLDFERVGPLVLEILSKVIDLPASALFVIDKDKDETVFSASSGVAPKVAKGYTEAYLYGAQSADETFACTTVLDHKRLMVVFCAAGDRLEGMGVEDRLVLQAVSSELVVAVENSQLYKLTKRLSITDELTGLYNYRYLQQRLDDEFERSHRYGRSLSLLMLDADDFKRFNDTYGHIAGDVALAEIGEVMCRVVREIDVVCRYGGEEFAVLLPETDAEGAFVAAEKIREAVAMHEFADETGDRGIRLTVSVGLATYPSTATDREELLRQADDALYTAKSTGRDRVRAPSSEVVRVADALPLAPATDTEGEGL
ncbi:MAG: GGDEF domain-containing protein [Coriobacteriia bacterium]|nr:GGDEF domain-containing protein [Coriobacteriia bacterium]